MSKIKLINISKILETSELVKKKVSSEQYKKLMEESDKNIKVNHIEEGKTYLKAKTYIAR